MSRDDAFNFIVDAFDRYGKLPGDYKIFLITKITENNKKPHLN